MDVSGKSALVTGGGRGIGRGIALVLARNGADVAVVDLNADAAGAVAAEVEALGRRSLGVAVDVTDRSSVEAMVSRVIDSFGRIDVLVNNAGIIAAPGWEGRERSNDDDWDQIYDVNVKGIVHVTEAVTPQMIERRYGKIVNIASGAGRVGSPGNPPYNVSKAGVISYTQASALELAPHNINVNSICPGLLWTPMWERFAGERRGPRPEAVVRARRRGEDSPRAGADARGYRQPGCFPGIRLREEHHRAGHQCQRRLADGLRLAARPSFALRRLPQLSPVAGGKMAELAMEG